MTFSTRPHHAFPPFDNSICLLHGVLYLIIAASLWYRLDYIFEYNPIHHIWSDTRRHWEQGIDVLRFGPMSQTDPIGFQLYMGALAKLTLKIPALVAFYTFLLCALTPWIWYRFLRELQPSKTAALIGWSMLSIIPSWISIYGYFMQETLFLPLLGAAIWATWRCQRKQTPTSFLIMVTLWIAAGLTRGIAIPMAAIACSWLWLAQPEKIKKALYSLALLGLVLGPLTFRSYHIMHFFAPHGIGEMNQIYAKSGAKAIEIQYHREGARWGYIFQSPAVEAKPFAPFSDWQSNREGKVSVFIDIDKGKTDWEKALEQHTLSTTDYTRLVVDNFILLFFTESWPDSNQERFIGKLNYQTRGLWFALGLISLLATIAMRRQLKNHALLPVLITTWFMVQCLLPISVNEGRYRMPFNGLIIAQIVLLFAVRTRFNAKIVAPMQAAALHTKTVPAQLNRLNYKTLPYE